MADLIDRQAAIDELSQRYIIMDNPHYIGYNAGLDEALKVIKALPPVQPKRGKWTDKSGGIEGAWNYCSVCGEQAIDLYDFCPNCGAKMEG